MIQTILGIDGMMCGMCEAHVSDAVRRNLPVKSVKTSRKKKQCVILSEDFLDEERLRKLIDETGYELTSVEALPYKKKSIFG